VKVADVRQVHSVSYGLLDQFTLRLRRQRPFDLIHLPLDERQT
jgi:hypothetical protein